MTNNTERSNSSEASLNEMLSDEQRSSQIETELKESKGEKLARHDLEVIKSMQTEWGAALAGPFDQEKNSYNKIWIRDNALVALALVQAGETETATQITQGVFDILEQYRPKIQQVISEVKPYEVIDKKSGAVTKVMTTGRPYANERDVSLIHPVYKENGEELDTEWGWRQNDSIGNLLQAAGALGIVNDNKKITEELVKYLEVVDYWKADRGIWEEAKHAQVNTILSCVAGLKAVSDYVEVPDDLIDKGYEAVKQIPKYSSSDVRSVDLSQLNPFMLGEVADPYIIEIIEHELLRDRGVIRYHKDKYMSGGTGREAEWVLGLLMLGEAWLACGNNKKAGEYLKKVDKLRVNGDIPEAYVYKKDKYVANNHTPLTWAHALALGLRRQLVKK